MRADMVRALRLVGEREVPLDANGAALLRSAEGDHTMVVDAIAVGAMVSEGLLQRRRRKISRTDAGRAYLRRALAGGVDDPYRAQQQARVTRSVATASGREDVTANAMESPLAWLATRRDKNGAPMITPAQFEAGRRLFGDYARCQQRERVTQSWDASCVRADGTRERINVTEAALDARARVGRALDDVGPGLADVLMAVCCEELGLEAVEKRHGWPARSGKVVLRLALDRLAAHYGIGAHAQGGKRVAMAQWGTEDYRPTA